MAIEANIMPRGFTLEGSRRGRVSALSRAYYSFSNFASFGNCGHIYAGSDLIPECGWAIVSVVLEGTGHMPTLLKALAHGEWWMPTVSTDEPTSSGAAYCWSLQFMTTWNPACYVLLARSAGWTHARIPIT